MCNLCSKPLKDSKYYEVICRDATEHDREERIDDLENKNKEKKDEESRKAKEHEKLIEAYKADLKDLDDDELDKILESLRAELEELKEKLKPEKETKEASRKNYDVLLLEPYQDNTKLGDGLLIKLGSTDEQTKGNAKDDDLLKQLGSVD